MIRQPATGQPQLGFDCGLGTKEAVVNGSGYPVALSERGTFGIKTACNWIGDVGQTALTTNDGTNEPLVSDQDEAYSPSNPAAICSPPPGSTNCGKIGGGFTADIVYLQTTGAGASTTNGFDMVVGWDPKVLSYVEFDQSGLPWATNSPFTGVFAVDNAAGTLHIAQVIFVALGGDFVFFRVRFDVVGVGNTALTISADTIVNPNAVPHTTVQGSFSSETFFDTTPAHTLNWAASFTNSTPINPGGPNTFQATVSGGTAPYVYAWQFDSTNTGAFIAEATTNPAVVTLPSTFTGFRITLRVTDSAAPAHVIFLTQHISFLLGVQQPGSTAGTIAAGSTNTFNGFWLGGLPNYIGSWRFCPGLAFQTQVCAHPVSTVAATATQTNVVVGQTYKFAGVYTNTLTITDTEPPSIYTGSVTNKFTFTTTVTGSPLAYSLMLSSSATTFVPNQPVQLTAVAHYDPAYPVASRSLTIAVRFTFGDGGFADANIAMSTGGANSTTVSHNYVATGTFNTLAVGTDGSVSSIQETSNTVIENSPDFSLSSPSPNALTVVQGSTSLSSSITATLTTATSGPVIFSASGLPLGVTATVNNSPCTPTCTATISFTATLTATTGPATVKITAAGSGATHSTTLLLTVNPAPFDFSIGSPLPGSLTVFQGSTSSTSSITATIVAGTSAPVTFSTSALPTGVTATFTNNPCNPTCTVTVSFSAAASAAIGTVTVSINAVGGGASHSTSLSLTVSAPTITATFTVSPSSPTAGDTVSFSASVGGGNAPYTYTWDFGDGSTGSGPTPTHAFSAGGSFTVTLSVSDSSTPHAAGSATHTLSIAQRSPSFAPTLTSPPSLAGVALVVILIIAGLAYVRSRRKKPTV